jgi:hypothetical protein
MTPEIDAVATASDVFPRLLAQGFAPAGMPERAIDWLEVASAAGSSTSPSWRVTIRRWGAFDAIHDSCGS